MSIFNYWQLTPSYPDGVAAIEHIFPPKHQTFRAFEMFPPEQLSVVIIGQDPYPTPGDANGLAFSVNKGQKIPKSLVNIFKELVADIGCKTPTHGDLKAWAEQGVLLANASLSTLPNVKGAHQKEWEEFTTRWVRLLGKSEQPLVWILWGNDARSFEPLIATHHKVIASAHPSPLSAYRGFFGSQPFSKANQYLKAMGKPEINWALD